MIDQLLHFKLKGKLTDAKMTESTNPRLQNHSHMVSAFSCV